MRVLALSSGTSVDAIDVSLADLRPDQHEPTTLVLTPLGHREVPWPEPLRARLLELATSASGPGTWCSLDTEVGRAFGDAAAEALRALGPADLVASHGQTVFHDVVDGVPRGTLQIGQAAQIHACTGLPVVSDLRAADVAAGGHGAPLVSLLDALLYADRPTVAINIGGIANITVVGADRVVAGDTGPGNGLLDEAAAARGATHDVDGRRARAGTVDEAALACLLDDPYFAAPLPRSNGREHLNLAWVSSRLSGHGIPAPVGDDMFATLAELTVHSIADGVERACRQAGLSGAPALDRALVTGGGLRNPVLMEGLHARLPQLREEVEIGLDPDAKEAYLFALLGYLSVHALPGTTPVERDRPEGLQVTGAARPVVLGSLTPPMPVAVDPALVRPRRLRIG